MRAGAAELQDVVLGLTEIAQKNAVIFVSTADEHALVDHHVHRDHEHHEQDADHGLGVRRQAFDQDAHVAAATAFARGTVGGLAL